MAVGDSGLADATPTSNGVGSERRDAADAAAAARFESVASARDDTRPLSSTATAIAPPSRSSSPSIRILEILKIED
jgi:hypothetical protein